VFPGELSALVNLEVLDIESNAFTRIIFTLPPKLKSVFVGDNDFSGDILSPLCDSPTIIQIDILLLTSICDPLCFVDDVMTNRFDGIAICDGVVVQRNALIDFFHGAGGPNWKNNVNWGKSGVPYSFWYGITTKNGDVAEIHLPNNNLMGYLSNSLQNCSSLSTLNLNENFLVGEVPSELFGLTQLKYLYIKSNYFTGQFEEVPPNLISAVIGGTNNFSDNALAPFCDIITLMSLDIENLTMVCNPFCFDDGVLQHHSHDTPICPSVAEQRLALNEFFIQTNAAFDPTPMPTITLNPTLFPTPAPSVDANNAADYCPSFYAVDTNWGQTNTVNCEIQACPGSTLVLSGCEDYTDDWDNAYYINSESCQGDQTFRLFDSAGKEVAFNDVGCNLLCAEITYSVPNTGDPSICEIYSLHQGCFLHFGCGGQTRVTGGTVIDSSYPTNRPTMRPTTASPTYQYAWFNSTNWGTSMPYKDWYGISTYRSSVIGLDLHANGLAGMYCPHKTRNIRVKEVSR
jgi:hypothetical protein